MKILILLFVILFGIGPIAAQDRPFKIRFGITGTGTSDEGLWFFKESQGLGPQTFKFGNSWGFAIDLDYELSKRIIAGFHLSLSRTSFQLAIDGGSQIQLSDDHTSHNQFVTEVKYVISPNKNFRPFVGANAGWLLAKDIRLGIGANDLDFQFINPFIYGIAIGFDLDITSKGWAIHFIMRGQTFEYTTNQTSVTFRQTLLDQVWWMNFNHLQLGISKDF